MQRALAFALLAKGQTLLSNVSWSDDCVAASNIITQLGAKVKQLSAKQLLIDSDGLAPLSSDIRCGESGLALRLFAMLAALCNQKMTMQGRGSLLKRPIDFFEKNLPLFGVEARTANGYLPMSLNGELLHADVQLSGAEGSQYITGLLVALSQVSGRSRIRVQNLTSRPYIDLTISMMRDFGVHIAEPAPNEFIIEGIQTFRAQPYSVEGDWSGAAFWLVAGALNGSITVKGLDDNSVQGDKAILEALKQAGAHITTTPEGLLVQKNKLKGFAFDATHCPDLFPPLAALAIHCEGVTEITGIERLTHKESNRALTIREEFSKLGADIHLENNKMYIRGGIKPTSRVKVSSRNDHRIAMGLAIAARGIMLEMTEAEAVTKSYPNFFEDLQSLILLD